MATIRNLASLADVILRRSGWRITSDRSGDRESAGRGGNRWRADRSSVVAVFGLGLFRRAAAMRIFAASGVAVERSKLLGAKAGHFERPAIHGSIENQPAFRPFPKQPGVAHPLDGLNPADDETDGMIVHLVSDPERFGFAIAGVARFGFLRSLGNVG